MKKRLVNKIQKLKKKEDLARIVSLIMDDNSLYVENNNGIFMFFHKLQDDTYLKIENELLIINRNKTNSAANSDTLSEKKEYQPYSADDFPSQKGISPKLKFSNREKSIIKRKQYDENISQDIETNIIYTDFNMNDQ